MFKNISVKKAKTITAIMCILIGIILCVIKICSLDNVFSTYTLILVIIFVILFPMILYLPFDIMIFAKRTAFEENMTYVQSFLSTEEYRKINLKLDNNEFLKLSVEESTISYYAKIKSDKEVEISIRKDEKEISKKTIDIYCLKRFFTN